MFSKQCQFKPSEIEIIWDESFPAQKFPEQFLKSWANMPDRILFIYFESKQ